MKDNVKKQLIIRYTALLLVYTSKLTILGISLCISGFITIKFAIYLSKYFN